MGTNHNPQNYMIYTLTCTQFAPERVLGREVQNSLVVHYKEHSTHKLKYPTALLDELAS
jgi:hypothetical protein